MFRYYRCFERYYGFAPAFLPRYWLSLLALLLASATACALSVRYFERLSYVLSIGPMRGCEGP